MESQWRRYCGGVGEGVCWDEDLVGDGRGRERERILGWGRRDVQHMAVLVDILQCIY